MSTMLNVSAYSSVQKKRLLSLISIVILFQLLLLFWLHFSFNNFKDIGMNPRSIGRTGVVIFSFVELVFFKFFIPVTLCLLSSVNNSGLQGNTFSMLPFLQAGKKKEVLCTVVFVTYLISTVFIPAGYLYLWQVPIRTLFDVILILFLTGIFISALCHITLTLFHDSFAAVTATFLVLFSLVSGVILINPFLEWAGNVKAVIWTALLVNPLVAVSSAINLDILRTDPLYYLSLVSVFEFHYPGSAQFWFFYGFVSLVLFTIKIKLSEKIVT